MIRQPRVPVWPAYIFVLAGILFSAGCAAKTVTVETSADPWGDPDSGLILEYRMTEGQVLKYEGTGAVLESGEVMGQVFDVETKTSSEYSFMSKGMAEGNHQLEVTVNAMNTEIASPQGDLSPDMSGVIGKSFMMVLSPLGIEVDVSGAKALKFEISGSTRNLESGFQVFFPDMPEEPVKIGDSWPTSFTITDNSGGMAVTITVDSVNTLDGFETVDGMECARIKSMSTGTISGQGSQQGADMVFAGDVEGTDLWYFAYEEGLFVKMTTEAFIDAVIDVTGIQEMTIPTTQERTGEVKLVSK